MAIRPKKHSGFTLIELMIVVAIIGIMTAICIPSFVRLQCRAKQSEAKEALKSIWIIQETYHGEYDQYLDVLQLTTFGGLDATTLKGRYYNYTFSPSGALGYTMIALDSTEPVYTLGTEDRWYISDDEPRPLNLVDRCGN